MKMADVLHSIADLLDQHGDDGDISGDNLGKEADDYQHQVDGNVEHGGAGDVEVGIMIPPLQQKLEILKKTAGMDNALDDEPDELDDIKKLTGIKAVVQQMSGEDNDITG